MPCSMHVCSAGAVQIRDRWDVLHEAQWTGLPAGLDMWVFARLLLPAMAPTFPLT
jgi:hypothetical protein